LAEFLGTALFIFLGDSSVALTIFHKDTIGGAAYLAISMGFGLGLMCALYVAGGSSGGHFNPAVTIASAVYREFPWRRVPGYIVAQTLGAFVGAALTYAQYRSAFSDYDGGTRQVQGPHGTAGIFATYPAGYLTNLNAAWNEGVATALLIIGIFGCTDKRGMLARSHVPIAVGLIFTTIALCIGHGTGFALNPARDFGPRVFTAIAGWGKDVFTASDYYFWIPLVVPIVGGVLGGLVYDTFIH
ncbi:aquaporin, partial [Ramicandelaber brevisporus]